MLENSVSSCSSVSHQQLKHRNYPQVHDRVTFGRPLVERDTIMRDIALSRIDIDQLRLLVIKTALMMDLVGNKVADSHNLN